MADYVELRTAMRFLFLLFLLVGPAATFLVACTSEQAPERPSRSQATPVVVEALSFEPLRTHVEAVGTSRAVRSVEIYPATSGEVVAVNFEPGQRVEAGQVLVELDSRDERLAVELAQVQLADAERLYARYVKSGDSGAVLPTTIDTARTQVEASRIALDQARVALDFRSIEAAFDGYVGITEVDAGDRVNENTLITTLDDRSALLVSFELPEVLIRELGVGDEVRLGTWQDRGLALSGEIVDIGSRIDPATRTFVARARVDNAADELRPGMSFRVTADIDGQRYPAIAETAVQWGADGAYIWTVVGGEARRMSVDIVQRNEGRVLVDADLARGDLVVVEGIQRMRDGIPVEHAPVNLAGDMARVN
jgi:RND family efflux transporter MFP subunit